MQTPHRSTSVKKQIADMTSVIYYRQSGSSFFGKAEARMAITFTRATFHFSVIQSIIHLNVRWLPRIFFFYALANFDSWS